MSIFELLSKIDNDEILDLLYRDGKKKAFCPIMFLNDTGDSVDTKDIEAK